MSQEQKKPEEEQSFFAEITGAAKQELNEMRQDLNDGIDGVMRITHNALEKAKDAYTFVEEKVGRDRLWGAGFGAKAGGLFAATKPHPFYIPAIGLGVAFGAAAGFIAGPYLAKRYKNANGIGNDNDSEDAQPPPAP